MIRLALALVLLSATPVWAGPSPAVAISEGSGTNQTVYTTSSFSITANRLAILIVQALDSAGNTATPPAITGHETWRSVAHDTNVAHRVHVWCKDSGAGSTGTIEADFTGVGDSQSRAIITVIEWSGADLTGNCEDKILQKTAHKSTDTNTSTVTFAAFSDDNNRPFLVIAKAAAGTATNEWTEIYDTLAEQVNTGLWLDSTADTEVVVTWSDATSATVLGMEMEIVGAAASADIQMGTGMCSGGFCD